MNFEQELEGPADISPKVSAPRALNPELLALKSDTLAKIPDAKLYPRFERTFERAVQDAEECSKMGQSSRATSKIDEQLPLTKMKRSWGEQSKDAVGHYEQMCRGNALNGFLKIGLPQDDADKLVLEIFKQ